jgi:hypothetical protein
MFLLGDPITQSLGALEDLEGCLQPDLRRRVACFVESISTPCHPRPMTKSIEDVHVSEVAQVSLEVLGASSPLRQHEILRKRDQTLALTLPSFQMS